MTHGNSTRKNPALSASRITLIPIANQLPQKTHKKSMRDRSEENTCSHSLPKCLHDEEIATGRMGQSNYCSQSRKKTNNQSNDCSQIWKEEEDGRALILGLLKCGHAFQFYCIWKWMESHTKCPICKTFINLSSKHIKAVHVCALYPEMDRTSPRKEITVLPALLVSDFAACSLVSPHWSENHHQSKIHVGQGERCHVFSV